jgi:hypothetical protein
VCGEFALAIHELIDDIPASVHIAILRGTHRLLISYPPTTVTLWHNHAPGASVIRSLTTTNERSGFVRSRSLQPRVCRRGR